MRRFDSVQTLLIIPGKVLSTQRLSCFPGFLFYKRGTKGATIKFSLLLAVRSADLQAISARLGEHVTGPYEGKPKPPSEVVVVT